MNGNNNDGFMGHGRTDDPNYGTRYRTAWLQNGDAATIDLETWGKGFAGKTWVRGLVGKRLVDINVDHIVAVLIPELAYEES